MTEMYRERAGALFDTIDDCGQCPAREECRRHVDIDCLDILAEHIAAHEMEG